MVYEMLQQFSKSLDNLSVILDKSQNFAETKKIDQSVLLNYRLAPDQLPFVKQIQICTDTAKFMSAKLSETPAPVFEDKEQTISELKDRISKTQDYIKGFEKVAFQNYATIKTTNPRIVGKYLSGNDYLIQYAIPNFFFHLSTAYSILRHMGVSLGKMDYLGTMPYKDL